MIVKRTDKGTKPPKKRFARSSCLILVFGVLVVPCALFLSMNHPRRAVPVREVRVEATVVERGGYAKDEAGDYRAVVAGEEVSGRMADPSARYVLRVRLDDGTPFSIAVPAAPYFECKARSRVRLVFRDRGGGRSDLAGVQAVQGKGG